MDALTRGTRTQLGLSVAFRRNALLVVMAIVAAAVLIPPVGSFGPLTVGAVILMALGWILSDSPRVGPTGRAVLMILLNVTAGVCGVAGAELKADAIIRWLNCFGSVIPILIVMGRPVVPALTAYVASASAMIATVSLRTGLSLGELVSLAPLQAYYGLLGLFVSMIWFGLVVGLRRRTASRETARTAAELRDAVAHEKLRARSRDLARAFAAAEPILRRAAAGTLTPADRRQALVVEAALRDRLRASRLAEEPLLTGVASARARHVQIDLLDDGPPREPLPTGLMDQLADRVAEAGPGDRITIRLDPSGGPTLGTLVVERSDGIRERRDLPHAAADASRTSAAGE